MFSLTFRFKREVRNLYAKTNVLNRRFSKLSSNVNLLLFKSSCVYMPLLYGLHLTPCRSSDRLKACFSKCIKAYSQRYTYDCCLTIVYPHLWSC